MSGQKIQVPKMEVMYQKKAVLGDGDSLTLSLTSIQVKFSVRIPPLLPDFFGGQLKVNFSLFSCWFCYGFYVNNNFSNLHLGISLSFFGNHRFRVANLSKKTCWFPMLFSIEWWFPNLYLKKRYATQRFQANLSIWMTSRHWICLTSIQFKIFGMTIFRSSSCIRLKCGSFIALLMAP